jgi:hypothetical protein
MYISDPNMILMPQNKKINKKANMEAFNRYNEALKNLASMESQIREDILNPLKEAESYLDSDSNTITSDTPEAQTLLEITRLTKSIENVLSHARVEEPPASEENTIEDIPGFEGTMDSLDNLGIR